MNKTKISEEIQKILEKNKAVLVVNLLPANFFTRIFKRFIKVNYFITVEPLNQDGISSSEENKGTS
jgi:hypothetical protein